MLPCCFNNKVSSCCDHPSEFRIGLNYILMLVGVLIIALSVIAVIFLDLGPVNSMLILTGGCSLGFLSIVLSSVSLVYSKFLSIIKKKKAEKIEKNLEELRLERDQLRENLNEIQNEIDRLRGLDGEALLERLRVPLPLEDQQTVVRGDEVEDPGLRAEIAERQLGALRQRVRELEAALERRVVVAENNELRDLRRRVEAAEREAEALREVESEGEEVDVEMRMQLLDILGRPVPAEQQVGHLRRVVRGLERSLRRESYLLINVRRRAHVAEARLRDAEVRLRDAEVRLRDAEAGR